jgi:hypothetical protein
MPGKREEVRDEFAAIAGAQAKARREGLVQPEPAPVPRRVLPLAKDPRTAAFGPAKKPNTPKQLRAELARWRKRFEKYMRDLSPTLRSRRIRKKVDTFSWRRETQADRRDFGRVLSGAGSWEKVHIPHYGGPTGRAVTYYRTTVDVTERMLGRGALFITFKGVDYEAHVFMNGSYLGSHEGFFGPFEFEFTHVARKGRNTLVVKVENDFPCKGHSDSTTGGRADGKKIYAATGMGWDDPKEGWHHCPPGMGIYQDVWVEARSPVHIHDIFVRPLLEQERAELWLDVWSCNVFPGNVSLEIAVYGRNFRKTVLTSKRVKPDHKIGSRRSRIKLGFRVPKPRAWEPESPWLYEVQVKLRDAEGRLLDTAARSFGMRSFTMDTAGTPKGMLRLNGMPVRLRGANTMGHLQQCVAKRKWAQLRDDILLAKICNMNFLRITQRPVQPEIYDFCDRLGMMTQTDLPLFGRVRRPQFNEVARQAGEMERLVRSHPCNVVISYINEPGPAAWGTNPLRQLTRDELESMFEAADRHVLLENPDQVIKPIDGDYDPPGPGLPDNHCYCGWYNGHMIDLGKLHKGHWQSVKPGWYYGCGEFGAEGLDPVRVMRKYYPAKWLPHDRSQEKEWTPRRIAKAQTGELHCLWFEAADSLADWVRRSQEHQAWIVRLQAEAFRRDNRMVTFAVHLFIDAWPGGWMKAIMDVDRGPKPAYFAYRDALQPMVVSLRSDRRTFWAGEAVEAEAWICNDTHEAPAGTLHYQMEADGRVLAAGKMQARVLEFAGECKGIVRFRAPSVAERTPIVLRLGLASKAGKLLHDTEFRGEVFPARQEWAEAPRAYIVGSRKGTAARLAGEMGMQRRFVGAIRPTDSILIDDVSELAQRRNDVDAAVRAGARAVILEATPGTHSIAGTEVTVEATGMGQFHFAARDTGHRLVAGFEPEDFKFWYDEACGYVTPIVRTVFEAEGWDPVLKSGNGDFGTPWHPRLAAAERTLGQGAYRICLVSLAGRTATNPVADRFARRLLGP